MKGIMSILTLSLICVGAVQAADWPQFRGPSRDGISQEEGLLQTWPEGGPDVVWRSNGIGHGWSSVAVAAGAIYTTGVIEDTLTVTSLDLAGKVRWQRPLEPATEGSGYKGSRSTPTVDDTRLYLLSGSGTVYCLGSADGEAV